MFRFFSATIPAVLLFSSIISARETHHIGYWKSTTLDSSQNVQLCKGVETESNMLDVLTQAGWRISDGIPSINWNNDEAVIIASHDDLVFYGLFKIRDTIVLSYGPNRQFSIPGIDNFSSYSIPSAGRGTANPPPTPPPSVLRNQSIIVISHPRDLDDGRDFFCHRRQP